MFSIVSLLFFISLIVFGNFILLNLFIAVMLDAFENLKDVDLDKEEDIGEDLR